MIRSRWIPLLVLLANNPWPLGAQQERPPVQEDERVRIRLEGRSIEGSVESVVGDTIRVWVDRNESWILTTTAGRYEASELRMGSGEPALPVPLLQVEAARGTRSGMGRGAVTGLSIGAALGTVVMLGMGRGGDEGHYWPELTILPGALLGGLVGTAIGVAHPIQLWEPVPLRGMSLPGLQTAAGGGLPRSDLAMSLPLAGLGGLLGVLITAFVPADPIVRVGAGLVLGSAVGAHAGGRRQDSRGRFLPTVAGSLVGSLPILVGIAIEDPNSSGEAELIIAGLLGAPIIAAVADHFLRVERTPSARIATNGAPAARLRLEPTIRLGSAKLGGIRVRMDF